MYKEQLYNSLLSLVPFWSTNLIQILGYGNEYNILFNIILSELLKISKSLLSNTILIIITFIILILLFGHKLGFNFNLNYNIINRNIIILVGKEGTVTNNSIETTIFYCDKILALNYYLINDKKIKNITYINDLTIIINDIYNFRVCDGIYLDIQRTIVNENHKLVSYKIWSYKKDINEFINKIIRNYKTIINSEITLIGDEHNKVLNYPEPIHAINYYVNINFKFPKLKCMKLKNNDYDNLNDLNSNNNTNNNPINNNNNNTTNNVINKKNTKVNNNDYAYTLDNIMNFNLGNNIYLNIYRENSQVFYNIKSNNICCKEWLEDKINIYNQNKNCKFKNKLVLTGKENIYIGTTTYKDYYYSKQMWTLNWLLIEKLEYQNYECVNGDETKTLYEYILEPLELFKIRDDLYLTIEKQKRLSLYIDDGEIHEYKHNNNMDIIYTLHSNTLNIKNILKDYVKEFDDYRNEISTNRKLYHFTYLGMRNSELIFNSRILSEENTTNELFETFDKIHNEHTDNIIRDINKLKDINYYKSHGLKRKKGYLFHGLPGCGKTSSVVAMALYDSRHIIEIPFSLLTTHNEFEEIMNLKSINNIEINNNNIILLFDEIDIGMEKISSKDSLNRQLQSNTTVSSVIEAFSEYTIENDKTNTTRQKINLGTLLSKLDGIGNYNGLIIVGTTNHINRLDPSLYRELRLTPIEFKQLRKCDCIKIIQSYFGSNYDQSLNDIIKDRVMIPTKLISLCQQNDDTSIETFFEEIIKPLFI